MTQTARKLEGAEYHNCDHFTDAEMEVISGWETATEEKRHPFREKYRTITKGLFRIDPEDT